MCSVYSQLNSREVLNLLTLKLRIFCKPQNQFNMLFDIQTTLADTFVAFVIFLCHLNELGKYLLIYIESTIKKSNNIICKHSSVHFYTTDVRPSDGRFVKRMRFVQDNRSRGLCLMMLCVVYFLFAEEI